MTNKLILSGNVATSRGEGEGGIGLTWRRTTSNKSWQEYGLSFGNGNPMGGLGASYFRHLTDKTHLHLSGSSQLYRNALVLSSGLNLNTRFSEKVTGSMG